MSRRILAVTAALLAVAAYRPDDLADPPALEPQVPTGRWALTAAWDYDPASRTLKSQGRGVIDTLRLTFRGEKVLIEFPGNGLSGTQTRVCGYRCDPTCEPHRLDVTDAKGEVTHMVYGFRDGRLYLCHPETAEAARPRDLTPSRAGEHLMELRPLGPGRSVPQER
jgi:uncharacterized protein (TIGR03067 family)